MMRTIQIHLRSDADPDLEIERITAYLYSNFEVGVMTHAGAGGGWVVELVGVDRAGWTADAQAERLWSGLIPAKVSA